MVILHDAIKTIQNVVFVFFFKRARSLKKQKHRLKKQVCCFFFQRVFLT